jgi:molybdate transport system substrate-binding protein
MNSDATNQPTSEANRNAPVIFSAAASTKEVIEELTAEFSDQFGHQVTLNLGASNGLANQIISGAPAHLFLSANQQWADELTKAGVVQATTNLLTNRLVLVVPDGNPAGVKNPSDLLSASVLKIALAGEQVPAGDYANQALTNLGILRQLVDAKKIVRGQDIRSALSYVERGEAEAGIVYATDVAAGSGVRTVYEFDASLHEKIIYILVLLKNDGQNSAARELYEFLQSHQADESYRKFGFTPLRLDPAGGP